jgi:hypothetical protein
MLSPDLSGDLGDSSLVSEQQNLAARREPRPALNGIPLNDAEMPFEGFGNSKDRQHAGSSDWVAQTSKGKETAL